MLLKAGELSARLVGSDLFAVTWRGVEVLQRLYYAVRDAPWNTIPGRLTDTNVDTSDGAFVVRLRQAHRYQDIDLELAAEIEGTADGVLLYRADTTCRGDFMFSKIGLNLHHGMATYRQRAFVAGTLEGRYEGRFDDAIAPQLIRGDTLTAMFPHFDSLDVDLGEVAVRFDFDGDRFETQDHRNWGDANWKTYGTPLEYGFPMAAERGQTMSQQLRLTCSGGPATGVQAPSGGVAEITLTDVADGRFPAIGVALDGIPEPHQAEAIRALSCAHVRLTVQSAQRADDVATACRAVSDLLGTGLELVVLIDPETSESAASEIAEALARSAVPLARVVCLAGGLGFSEFRGATPADLVVPFAERLARRLPDVSLASGTSQSYNVIARDRPAYPSDIGIAFAANPQIHACDDTSVMQNAGAFAEVVNDCHRLYPGRAVSVTPIHLIAADGPFPAGPPEHPADRPQDDPRHVSPFGAAWALAAVSSLASAGTDSATLFDGVGARGVVSADGSRHPVGSVIAMMAGLHGVPVRSARVSDPEGLGVIDADGPSGRTVFVANLRPNSRQVIVRRAASLTHELRVVDEIEPSGSAGHQPRVFGDDVVLCLAPYATAVLRSGSRQ